MTPPVKWPPTGSTAVMVWPAPSSVKPLGTMMLESVVQSATSVIVVPEVVKVQGFAVDARATPLCGAKEPRQSAASSKPAAVAVNVNTRLIFFVFSFRNEQGEDRASH